MKIVDWSQVKIDVPIVDVGKKQHHSNNFEVGQFTQKNMKNAAIKPDQTSQILLREDIIKDFKK